MQFIQAVSRSWLERSRYLRQKKAVELLQAAERCLKCSSSYNSKRRAVMHGQRLVRRWLVRRQHKRWLATHVVMQASLQAHTEVGLGGADEVDQNIGHLVRLGAATLLQRRWRQRVVRMRQHQERLSEQHGLQASKADGTTITTTATVAPPSPPSATAPIKSVASYAGTAKSGEKMTLWTLEKVLITIAKIYEDKMKAEEADEREGTSSEMLGLYIYQWMKHQYGLKQLAQKNLRSFISSVQHWSRGEHDGVRRVAMFAHMTGLSPDSHPWPVSRVSFFLVCLSHMVEREAVSETLAHKQVRMSGDVASKAINSMVGSAEERAALQRLLQEMHKAAERISSHDKDLDLDILLCCMLHAPGCEEYGLDF